MPRPPNFVTSRCCRQAGLRCRPPLHLDLGARGRVSGVGNPLSTPFLLAHHGIGPRTAISVRMMVDTAHDPRTSQGHPEMARARSPRSCCRTLENFFVLRDGDSRRKTPTVTGRPHHHPFATPSFLSHTRVPLPDTSPCAPVYPSQKSCRSRRSAAPWSTPRPTTTRSSTTRTSPSSASPSSTTTSPSSSYAGIHAYPWTSCTPP